MKIRKSILLGAFAAVLCIGAIVFLTQRPRPIESAVDSPQPAEQEQPLPPRSATIPSASVTPSVAVVDLPEVAGERASDLRVPAELVLAKVNGKHVQLKDLVPLRADEQDQAMTPEEYESRLNRAIEMELTFQAAAARGVDLTPEQKKRVGGVAQKHEAAFRHYQKQGVTWSSVTPAQVEFEQRLTAALLLQQNLVAREAGVAPGSDGGIQLRYEQALHEILGRLKASRNISLTGVTL